MCPIFVPVLPLLYAFGSVRNHSLFIAEGVEVIFSGNGDGQIVGVVGSHSAGAVMMAVMEDGGQQGG